MPKPRRKPPKPKPTRGAITGACCTTTGSLRTTVTVRSCRFVRTVRSGFTFTDRSAFSVFSAAHEPFLSCLSSVTKIAVIEPSLPCRPDLDR